VKVNLGPGLHDPLNTTAARAAAIAIYNRAAATMPATPATAIRVTWREVPALGSGTLDVSSGSPVVDELTSEPLVEVLVDVTVDVLAEPVEMVSKEL